MDRSVIDIYGVKCDNPACNYSDMSVRYEQYPEYVNKPCPKCGTVLLTQKEVEVAAVMIQAAEMAKKLFPELCGEEHGTTNINFVDKDREIKNEY